MAFVEKPVHTGPGSVGEKKRRKKSHFISGVKKMRNRNMDHLRRQPNQFHIKYSRMHDIKLPTEMEKLDQNLNHDNEQDDKLENNNN